VSRQHGQRRQPNSLDRKRPSPAQERQREAGGGRESDDVEHHRVRALGLSQPRGDEQERNPDYFDGCSGLR
jgi:hypothetical protein